MLGVSGKGITEPRPNVFDSNGNTTFNGQQNVYDFENRLVQAGGVNLVYDGDGNRVQETVAGVTTKYLVGEINPTGYAQVFAELNGTNGLLRGYEWGLQLEAVRDFTVNSFGTFHYYGRDGHGSVRWLTDSNGAITDAYDYDAFGNLIAQAGTTFNNYLFAGEQFDPALGIYYNRARYYDQRQGRFWTADTFEGSIFDPSSLHKYLYTSANPANRIDPSGRFGLAETTVANSIGSTLDAIDGLSGSSIMQGLLNCGQTQTDCGKATWTAYWQNALFFILQAVAVPLALSFIQSRGQSWSLKFSQTGYNDKFGTEEFNPFKGQTVYDVAAKLKSGNLTPRDVPVKFIRSRPFQKTALIVNTRSAVALRLAGVPVSKWNLIDATDEAGLKDYIYNERLPANGLEDDGIDFVNRINGPEYSVPIGGPVLPIGFDL